MKKINYWNLEKAVAELERRQKDKELSTLVNNFLSECPIPQGKFGFICRHIATCRYEDVNFFQRCQELGISPVWIEYAEDAFCSNNPSKMRIVNLRLHGGEGRNGGPKLKNVKIVSNLPYWENRPISQMITEKGVTLRDFHHGLRAEAGLGNQVVLDVSSWLKKIGNAEMYYKYMMAFSTIRGVLFESFESFGFNNLEAFKTRVVVPAWELCTKLFGCEPLIVMHPVVDNSEEEHRMLNWYPQRMLTRSFPLERAPMNN